MQLDWQGRLSILRKEMALRGWELQEGIKTDQSGPVAFLVNKKRLYNMSALSWTTGVTLYVSDTLRKTGKPLETISIFDGGSIRLSPNFAKLLHD